jgi:hypothetical protein
MNIDNVNEEGIEIPKGSIIVAIFEHQEKLRQKYDVIERKNGMNIPEQPWHIDDSAVQYRIKDMFWRTTEEIAEAIDAAGSYFDNNVSMTWCDKWNEDAKLRHFFEELADALHFLTEASILANLDPTCLEIFISITAREGIPNFIKLNTTGIKSYCADFIYALGITANSLKNKPWKVTQMSTDVAVFLSLLEVAWIEFFNLWRQLGCSQVDMYKLYHRKMQVNTWRQNTQY